MLILPLKLIPKRKKKSSYNKAKGNLNKRGIILYRIQSDTNPTGLAVTICPEQARQFNVISALALRHSRKALVRQLRVKLNHDVPLYERVQTGRKTYHIISISTCVSSSTII